MRYFAYGSNMDPDQMAERCPGATALGRARLADHRLTFTWDSVRWGGGVGHVEPDPGGHTWGVLWELTDEHLAALDDYEQVAGGVYRRITVTIETDDGPCEAEVYLSNDGRYRRPSRTYVRALVRGARAHGLPDDYIRLLEETRSRRG